MTRRPRQAFSAIVFVLIFTTASVANAATPGSGPVVPELAGLEQAMTNYMASHGFEAGTLALMKNSKLVFRDGYGWLNTNKTSVIHPDNLFRLASVSKTITGCAIRKLMNAGAISSSTKVYSYLGIPPWNGNLGDTRITNITVQHLLDHQGGWTGGGSGSEAVFQTVSISTAMGLTYPAAASNIISWMWSQPLQFTPGTSNVYSNFGYQILGRVVEKASGKPFINYLREDMFLPVGVTNIIQSRSRPWERDPWEIWYADTGTTRSAVDFPTNITVRYVDGGHYLESFDAFGGLSASATDLCRYMLNYWVGGDRRIPGSSYGWTYLFYGSLPGVTTVISQSISQNSGDTNGLEFTALFNERTGGNDNEEAYNAIYQATTNITSWPLSGGGKIEWNVSATNVYEHAGSVKVRLVRTELASLAVKVSYTTYSRTAGTNSYAPSAGIVSCVAGETSKDIVVPINDDGKIGPDRDFSLELISASGGAWLGNRVTCLVRILDTDLILTNAASFPAVGSFQTRVLGATGLPVRVEFSTNLVNWQLLQNITNVGGSTTVTDNAAGSRVAAFYRAFVP